MPRRVTYAVLLPDFRTPNYGLILAVAYSAGKALGLRDQYNAAHPTSLSSAVYQVIAPVRKGERVSFRHLTPITWES